MNILNPPSHSTRLFTWVPETNELVCDISDLPRPVMGQVYDDACDLGMTLVSARTGKEIVVAVDAEVYDSEGDLQAWILRPVRCGAVVPFQVRIFND